MLASCGEQLERESKLDSMLAWCRVALFAALVGAACGASIKGALRAALRDIPACVVCAPPAGVTACSDGSAISKAMMWLNGEPYGPGAEYCFCRSLTMSGGVNECDGVA
jgi:hypothetical protein